MEDLIEQILRSSSASLASIVLILPVGYAFGAGMMATVNPCGFALLPAYISLFLGADTNSEVDGKLVARLFKALLVSIMVTLGFVALFGSVGLIIASGGYFLTDAMPWAGLFIGVFMVVLGLWLLVVRTVPYIESVLQLSTKVKLGQLGGMRSFLMFGIAYGIASLSCTLPVFLIVVGSSLASRELLNGLFQFLSYALGMGAVLMVITLSTVLFKGAIASYLRTLIPHLGKVSAGLMVLAGAFIVYYWLTIGALGDKIQGMF